MVKYIGFDLLSPFTKSYSQYASIKENGGEAISILFCSFALCSIAQYSQIIKIEALVEGEIYFNSLNLL